MQPRCASTKSRQVSTAVPRFYARCPKTGIKKSRYAAYVKGKKKRKSGRARASPKRSCGPLVRCPESRTLFRFRFATLAVFPPRTAPHTQRAIAQLPPPSIRRELLECGGSATAFDRADIAPKHPSAKRGQRMRPFHPPALGRHPEERSDEGPLFDCGQRQHSRPPSRLPTQI
jgi:hypothetical protein